uniref:Uncharacterized protein n=1 Tax=Arundo donax TaxID=35708 RepID=A0A0A9HK97_ARUDO
MEDLLYIKSICCLSLVNY